MTKPPKIEVPLEQLQRWAALILHVADSPSMTQAKKKLANQYFEEIAALIDQADDTKEK